MNNIEEILKKFISANINPKYYYFEDGFVCSKCSFTLLNNTVLPLPLGPVIIYVFVSGCSLSKVDIISLNSFSLEIMLIGSSPKLILNGLDSILKRFPSNNL